MKIHKNIWVVVVAVHLTMLGVSFQYFTNQNFADINLYWFKSFSTDNFVKLSPLPLRHYFVMYFNYPLVKHLHFPIELGFLIYSLISLLGFYMIYKIVNDFDNNKYSNVYIAFALLLPSFHHWTNMIGKEPFIFLSLSVIFHQLYFKKYKSLWLLFFILIIAVIRPHFLIILFVAVLLTLFFSKKIKVINKIAVAITLTLISFALATILFKTLVLQEFSYLNFIRLLDLHHEVLSKTDSYVPLEKYNLIYKNFTFYFRPYPWENQNIMYIFSGIESMFILLISITGIYFLLVNIYKYSYKVSDFEKIVIFYFLLFSLTLSLAYSNYGLISRMRVLSLPFFLILVVKWTSFYFNQKKQKLEEKT